MFMVPLLERTIQTRSQLKLQHTAGLNVDLGSFFELAELMIKLSKGTYGLLKIINQKTF